MPYATTQDLIDRFGEEELIALADRNNDGAYDLAVVERALADADALIDSYIGTRYDLPLTTTPEVLKGKAADLARYTLYKDAPTETVTENQKTAVRWLELVAAGKASLPLPSGADPAPSTAMATFVEISAAAPVFTQDALKDF